MIQKAALWLTFLYIPAFGVLLSLNKISLVSIFSLFYIASYFVIILALIIVNREEHTFRRAIRLHSDPNI